MGMSTYHGRGTEVVYVDECDGTYPISNPYVYEIYPSDTSMAESLGHHILAVLHMEYMAGIKEHWRMLRQLQREQNRHHRSRQGQYTLKTRPPIMQMQSRTEHRRHKRKQRIHRSRN